MEIDLGPCKAFTYRNSPSLKAFNVAKNYIYAITSSQIIQTALCSNQSHSHPVDFETAHTLVHENLIYIASRTDLYYFDKQLRRIGQRPPLSTSFVCHDCICSLGEETLAVFDAKQRQPCSEIDAKHGNGHCAAVASQGRRVYLGFESGKIYMIENMLAGIFEGRIAFDPQQPGNDTSARSLLDLKEPIFSILALGSWLFISSLNARLVRLEINTGKVIYTQLRTPPRKILSYRNCIICFEGRTVVFLNTDLLITGVFPCKFNIVDLVMADKYLYLGFEPGLIIAYDMEAVCVRFKICN